MALGFFGLGNLIYILVLLGNAACILSEDRFLARVGMSTASYDPAFGAGPESQSLKGKIVTLLSSIRMVMRFPLIAANLLIIVYEVVLG